MRSESYFCRWILKWMASFLENMCNHQKLADWNCCVCVFFFVFGGQLDSRAYNVYCCTNAEYRMQCTHTDIMNRSAFECGTDVELMRPGQMKLTVLFFFVFFSSSSPSLMTTSKWQKLIRCNQQQGIKSVANKVNRTELGMTLFWARTHPSTMSILRCSMAYRSKIENNRRNRGSLTGFPTESKINCQPNDIDCLLDPHSILSIYVRLMSGKSSKNSLQTPFTLFLFTAFFLISTKKCR